MKALDLFSGTQSWTKELIKLGYDVVNVDICDYKGKYKPTHLVNILEWDYKQYKVGEFDIICAGPPCIWYSTLQDCWKNRYKIDPKTKERYLYDDARKEKDLKYADSLVLKAREIIEYLKPKLWFIENPQTGLLKVRGLLDDYNFYDIDYCCYGFNYRKRTRIWTNKKDFDAQLCKKKLCPSIIKFNEINKCETFRMKHFQDVSRSIGGGNERTKRYKVPSVLIKKLLS